MIVIPAINAKTRDEALNQIKIASGFSDWIHIDICDGEFTKAKTWGTPEELLKLKPQFPNLRFEIHLMVQDPDDVLESWFKAGARRIVVHEETMENMDLAIKLAEENSAELMLSIVTTHSEWNIKSGLLGGLQVLAVAPGFAGQKFDEEVLAKIKLLRDKYPNARIEVDGGMNPETARLVKGAGADSIVSASYIFNSANPKKAYEALINV